MRLVIISGRSGSGKSTALHVMEDAGYYCIDNLPAGLLPPVVWVLWSRILMMNLSFYTDCGMCELLVAVLARASGCFTVLVAGAWGYSCSRGTCPQPPQCPAG